LAKLEYRRVSNRARALLRSEEGYDVEFKRSLSGLDSEDIVAFANSHSGGAILVGIEEERTCSGRQKGTIVGCSVSESERRKITDRAESCLPRIDVQVVIENASRLPFFRVEIPGGPRKPYCTSGGTYKTRGDGANKPLTPQRLLFMFMESESQAFVQRFTDATSGLEGKLEYVLEQTMALEQVLHGVFASAANAEALAQDAMGLSDETAAGVWEVQGKLRGLGGHSLPDALDKIDAILQHLGIEDPQRRAARTWTERETERLFGEGAGKEQIHAQLCDRWQALAVRVAWSDIAEWSTRRLTELQEGGGRQ
jgi:ATP-dependent DNA helicase RecG